MPGSDHCGTTHEWNALSFTTAATCIFLILLTVPLNIAVIVAIIKSKTYTSNFYIIMLNIALSDLFSGILAQPLGAALIIKEGMTIDPNPAEQKTFFISLFMIGSSSVLSMALLNFDRYISIQSPNFYDKLQKWHFVAALAFVWMISGFFGYMSLVIGFSSFVLFFSLVTVLFTVAVMCVTMRTFWKKLVTVSAPEDNRLSIDPNNQHSTVATTKVFIIGRFRASRNERRIIRTLFYMFAIFILSYFPIFLACIYLNSCKNCDCLVVHIVRDIVILAIFTSSLARPINFLLRLTNLRDELRCIRH